MNFQGLSLLTSLGLIAACFGCASGSKFTCPKAPQGEKALLYAFRLSSPPLLNKPAILVNGVKAADLTNKGYFELELDPGSYQIKAEWSWHSGVRDAELTVQAVSGQVHYLRIESSMHYVGPFMYSYKSGISLLDSNTALGAIARCALVEKRPDVEGLIRPTEIPEPSQPAR